MVDVAGMSINVASIFSGIFSGVLWVVALGVVGTILFFLNYLLSFKIKVRVLKVVNGRRIIKEDKAKEYKDGDGVSYYKLLRHRAVVPIPPDEAIEVNTKGQQCVDVYRTEHGEWIYRVDKNNEINNLQPFTTNQRLMYINQLKKAHEKKRKSIHDYIGTIVYVSALVIIVIALLIFYGDMAKPLLAAQDKQIQLETLYKEQLQIVKEIKNDIQVIRGEQSVTTTDSPPN